MLKKSKKTYETKTSFFLRKQKKSPNHTKTSKVNAELLQNKEIYDVITKESKN